MLRRFKQLFIVSAAEQKGGPEVLQGLVCYDCGECEFVQQIGEDDGALGVLAAYEHSFADLSMIRSGTC